MRKEDKLAEYEIYKHIMDEFIAKDYGADV